MHRLVSEFRACYDLTTVCTSSNACQGSLNRFINSSNSISSSSLNSTLTCSQQPVTYSVSQMTCNVIATLLQSLFPGKSTLTITRSLNSTLTPGGTQTLEDAGLIGGDGKVYAQLWYGGVEQFYCQGLDCQQTVKSDGGNVNGSTWVCPTLNCTCRPNTDFCGRTELVRRDLVPNFPN